jgi:acetyltransferase-like isoleucine patch superfamily enzyme
MKGASIGAGAVVGLRAVVTHSVPANCVAAGTPARVIRENVRWDRKLV